MSYTKMQRYTLYCCFYRAWCHCDVLRNPEQHLNGYQTVELQLASTIRMQQLQTLWTAVVACVPSC